MKETIENLEKLQSQVSDAWRILDLEKTKNEIKMLEKETARQDFWQNIEIAKTKNQKLSKLKEELAVWEKMRDDVNDLLSIAKMDAVDKEVNLRSEIDERYNKLLNEYKENEFLLLFGGKYDKNSAIVSFHSGTGGTDAQDWAEMLLRMIMRYCEKEKLKAEIVEISPGSEAGIKSCVVKVIGNYAYGRLKSEKGVHRLVRISPFDAEKMRHTSFALIEVQPLFDEVVEVEIKPEDLKIDVYRSGGHGGQSVNKTESAVRITHVPTGIKASCQNERSQARNKEIAMDILRSKLYRYYSEEIEEERAKIRGEYTEAAWGNQIRSYVLHPYKMVKDHRTDYETSDVEGVLDGNLVELVESFLRHKATRK